MGRRLVLVATSTAIAAAAVFACGSDDLLSGIDLDAGLTFRNRSMQKDVTAFGDDGATEGTTPDAGSGTITLPDGAVVFPDGGPVDPATGCQTCDCDNDCYNRPGCGDNTGTDCNDLDSNVHPDAGFRAASPSKDLDCTNSVEKQYPVVACAGHLLDCAATTGIAADAGCGQQASDITCAPLLIIGCQQSTTAAVTQACR